MKIFLLATIFFLPSVFAEPIMPGSCDYRAMSEEKIKIQADKLLEDVMILKKMPKEYLVMADKEAVLNDLLTLNIGERLNIALSRTSGETERIKAMKDGINLSREKLVKFFDENFEKINETKLSSGDLDLSLDLTAELKEHEVLLENGQIRDRYIELYRKFQNLRSETKLNGSKNFYNEIFAIVDDWDRAIMEIEKGGDQALNRLKGELFDLRGEVWKLLQRKNVHLVKTEIGGEISDFVQVLGYMDASGVSNNHVSVVVRRGYYIINDANQVPIRDAQVMVAP